MNRQQTAVKNFLMGAHYIDLRIQCKLEQIQQLNDLATKATSTITDMPGSPNRNVTKMEDVIVKIVDLQTEIEADIDQMIILKKQINDCINQVDDREGRMVLEERYLRKSKWEEIARVSNRSMRQIFRIHDFALTKIKIPESWQ